MPVTHKFTALTTAATLINERRKQCPIRHATNDTYYDTKLNQKRKIREVKKREQIIVKPLNERRYEKRKFASHKLILIPDRVLMCSRKMGS